MDTEKQYAWWILTLHFNNDLIWKVSAACLTMSYCAASELASSIVYIVCVLDVTLDTPQSRYKDSRCDACI